MALLRRRRPEEVVPDIDYFGRFLDQLGNEFGDGRAAPLEEPTAEALRSAMLERLRSQSPSELLFQVAGSYEVNVLHAVGLGYALRFAEGDIRAVAALPRDLARRLDDSDEALLEAGVIARELSSPGARLDLPEGETGSPRSRNPPWLPATVATAFAPKAELMALFAPGAAVWRELEVWVRSVGVSAARRRLRSSLDSAGVDGDFGMNEALDRINYERPFRASYVIAACEAHLG